MFIKDIHNRIDEPIVTSPLNALKDILDMYWNCCGDYVVINVKFDFFPTNLNSLFNIYKKY